MNCGKVRGDGKWHVMLPGMHTACGMRGLALLRDLDLINSTERCMRPPCKKARDAVTAYQGARQELARK